MEPRPSLRCLGYPALFNASGEVVRLRSRKHVAVVVYLALEPKAHRRDHLLELLWPKARSSEARHSLSTALSLLRARLGAQILRTDRHHVGLSRAQIDIDVDRLVGGDILGSDEVPSLDVAPFLDGFEIPDAPEFNLWKDRQQARLLPAIQAGLIQLMDRSRRTGNSRTIEAYADRMLALDELSEEGIRAKMEARAFAGDRLEALRVFERWKAQIAEELHAVPSALLEAMATRLRKRNIERHNEQAIPPIATDQWKGRIFVGRATEYSRLYGLWERIRSAEPAHAIILGDSGVGKSTLVERLCTAASLEGAVCARVQCYDIERNVPYSALITLVDTLRSQPGAAATTASALSALTGLCPALREQFAALPDPVTPDGETTRYLVADGFLQLVVAVAEEQPLLLVVDDVHHADEASLSVLHNLIRRLPDARASVLLVGRGEEIALSQQASKVREHGPLLAIQELILDRLPLEECGLLLDALLQEHPIKPPAATRQALIEATGGMPMVAELLARDWIIRGDEAFALTVSAMTHDSSSTADVPDPYAAVIDRATQQLDPATRSILHLASVLGPRLNDLSMYSIVDASFGQVLNGLSTLTVMRVLRESAGKLEFVNELLRARVYWSVPATVRKALHGRIVDRLAPLSQGEAGVESLEIAWHCMRSGSLERANAYLTSGARQAMVRGAIYEAERALSTALPRLNGQQRVDVTMLLAELLHAQSRWAELQNLLGELPREPDAQTDHARILEIACRRHLQPMTTRTCEILFGDLLGFCLTSPHRLDRVRAADAAASFLTIVRRKDLAERLLSATANVDTTSLPEWEQAQLTVARGKALYHAGRIEEAERQVAASIESLQSRGHQNSMLASLYSGLGAIAVSLGHYADAAGPHEHAHALASKLGNPYVQVAASAGLALVELRLGNLEAAAASGTEGLSGANAQYNLNRVAAAQSLALARAMQKRNDEALMIVSSFRQQLVERSAEWQLQFWDLVSADVFALVGRRVEAQSAARRATWDAKLAIHADCSTGQFARWAAATATSAREHAELRTLLTGLLGRLSELDKIDRLEVLLAGRRAGILSNAQEAMLAQEAVEAPAGFRRQLELSGFLSQL